MNAKALFAALTLTASAALGAAEARAAGDYLAGSAIANVPVLWDYAPATNALRLCYPTATNSLTCTATIAAFATKPVAGHVLYYRLSNNGSGDGALWIIDETASKEVLCGGTLTNGKFSISCVQGSGIK